MTKTFTRKIGDILESKYLTKSVENRLHIKRKLYRFQLKKGTSIGEQMNNYTKYLADLNNVDEVIKEQGQSVDPAKLSSR